MFIPDVILCWPVPYSTPPPQNSNPAIMNNIMCSGLYWVRLADKPVSSHLGLERSMMLTCSTLWPMLVMASSTTSITVTAFQRASVTA